MGMFDTFRSGANSVYSGAQDLYNRVTPYLSRALPYIGEAAKNFLPQAGEYAANYAVPKLAEYASGQDGWMGSMAQAANPYIRQYAPQFGRQVGSFFGNHIHDAFNPQGQEQLAPAMQQAASSMNNMASQLPGPDYDPNSPPPTPRLNNMMPAMGEAAQHFLPQAANRFAPPNVPAGMATQMASAVGNRLNQKLNPSNQQMLRPNMQRAASAMQRFAGMIPTRGGIQRQQPAMMAMGGYADGGWFDPMSRMQSIGQSMPFGSMSAPLAALRQFAPPFAMGGYADGGEIDEDDYDVDDYADGGYVYDMR